MQFVLTTFTQDKGCRIFAFDGVDTDRNRTPFTVRVDLGIIRDYGIRMQELPLLCRAFLERRDEASEMRALTFGAEEMSLFAQESVAAKAAAAQKRKPPRRPPTENNGAAWRVPTLT